MIECYNYVAWWTYMKIPNISKKQRNQLIVVGIIVFLALIVLPTMLVPPEATGMRITFYDAEGNELKTIDSGTKSFLPFLAIHGEGIEGPIYSLKIIVYFKVTTDIDYIGIDTRCWIEVVTVAAQTGSAVYTLAEHRLGWANTDLEGTFYRTTNEGHYLMSELLPPDKITEAAKLYGWQMSFNARIETSVGRQDGTIATVDDTCGIVLMLTWVETLTLDSWFGDW